MSSPYQSGPYQKEEAKPSETVDDLMLSDDETEGDSEQEPHRFVSQRYCFTYSGIVECDRTRH